MNTAAFSRLNQAMSWRALLDLAHQVEHAWDQAEGATLLAQWQLWAGDLAARYPECADAIGKANQALAAAPLELKAFIAAIVPLERQYSRGVFDADILNQPTDHDEAKGTPLPLVVVLDNIRSAFNVGAILRTSECLGVTQLHLCGYTSTPDEAKTRKTAMGTAAFLDWRHHTSTRAALEQLKSAGYIIYAAETGPAARSLYDTRFQTPAALLLGNERYGLDPDMLALVDHQVSIPMAGRKNSLNVGVALGVIGFEIRRQLLDQV